MQTSLFSSAIEVLPDPRFGRITYYPACVPADLVQAWFASLRDTIAWRSERRVMYQRELDVPRLVARFVLDDPALPAVLGAAAAAVRAASGADFNSVGLNFYRDGRDSVAPHNDKLHDLVVDAPIAILSLGAARRMSIRSKQAPRQFFHIDLAPGSLLLMSYATQQHLDHGIPKTTATIGARISLAFRQRLARG